MKPFGFVISCLAAFIAAGACTMGNMYMYDGIVGSYETNAYGKVMGEGVIAPPPSGDRFDEIIENGFIKVSDEPQSTFSIDADGASYAYMRRMITVHGYRPSANSVRIEEFLNYFTFNYPDPTDGKAVAINAETGPCPWNPSHRLLRLGLKGRCIPEDKWPTANFVFLIDVSGSMDSEDKLPLLKNGILSMLDYLRPDDQIAIVTYSGKVETLLKPTPVKKASSIRSAVRKLTASGCTNGGQALQDAYTLAEEAFIEGGNNRVILGTDGDFNVGVTTTDALLEMVENYAAKGIYLTACGFGSGNLNDSMMETVSNKGNGTYEYIDSEDEMIKVFVRERSRFVAVANDTKVQITFDPAVVESYRLIGYENRKLSNDDFENDKKDAGEIGSGQTVTALYEIVPAEGYVADKVLGRFDVRYKETLGSASIPLSLQIAAGSDSEMSPSLSFAAGIAAYGMLLRNSEYKGNATYEMAGELVTGGEGASDEKAQKQLADIIKKASGLKQY